MGSFEALNTADIDFLFNPPTAVLTQTATTTSIPTGLSPWTSVAFSDTAGVMIDNYSGHSTGTNPSRYTVVVAGWYTVSGAVCYAANATGVRGARCAKNGTAIQGTGISITNVGAGTATAVASAPRDVRCAVGDYLELQGVQNSGGALATSINADLDSMFQVRFIHF